ncbi:MAG TPA: response regulator [Burkholderiales bacterium]|nr:response regulator [Burkholderiales bacterium]
MSNELILIIEDDDNGRTLLRDVLQLTGYRTIDSATAEEGIVLAGRHRPALILMDIHLPGMNGIQALRSLRGDSETRNIPVIAVTASVMNDQQQEIMAAGFDGFERKPISVPAVLNTVRATLDGRAAPPA